MDQQPYSVGPESQNLQRRFLTVLPRLTKFGRFYFRYLNLDHQEEAVSEMIALSWKYFCRLVQRGKRPEHFIRTFAKFAARAVKNGRRLCGQRTRDTLSPVAQQKYRFRVEALVTERSSKRADYEERLHDNSLTPIPEQVQFRLDWSAWLTTRTAKDRRIIRALALNHQPLNLAHQFGMSPAALSQLRQNYCEDWNRFCSEPNEIAEAASVDAS